MSSLVHQMVTPQELEREKQGAFLVQFWGPGISIWLASQAGRARHVGCTIHLIAAELVGVAGAALGQAGAGWVQGAPVLHGGTVKSVSSPSAHVGSASHCAPLEPLLPLDLLLPLEPLLPPIPWESGLPPQAESATSAVKENAERSAEGFMMRSSRATRVPP